MRELQLLFKEAYKEVKQKPLEALGTLITFCVTCYLFMIVCYVIGG